MLFRPRAVSEAGANHHPRLREKVGGRGSQPGLEQGSRAGFGLMLGDLVPMVLPAADGSSSDRRETHLPHSPQRRLTQSESARETSTSGRHVFCVEATPGEGEGDPRGRRGPLPSAGTVACDPREGSAWTFPGPGSHVGGLGRTPYLVGAKQPGLVAAARNAFPLRRAGKMRPVRAGPRDKGREGPAGCPAGPHDNPSRRGAVLPFLQKFREAE